MSNHGNLDELVRFLATTAVERDRRGGTAKAERDQIRASGLLGLSAPREFGGAGAGWAEIQRAVRVLARVDASLAHLFGFHHLLLATIRLVTDHLNPRLEVKGAVLTMYDSRTRLSTEVGDEVRRHLGDRVYDTVIPRTVRLAEAPSFGRPIALYRDDSKGAQAYRELAAEFLGRRARRPATQFESSVPAYAGGAVA